MSSLPPVNGRLSEETLEDCHAFNDVAVTKTKIYDHHRTVDVIQELNPLDEEDDDE